MRRAVQEQHTVALVDFGIGEAGLCRDRFEAIPPSLRTALRASKRAVLTQVPPLRHLSAAAPAKAKGRA
jgi:hypothetical protein